MINRKSYFVEGVLEVHLFLLLFPIIVKFHGNTIRSRYAKILLGRGVCHFSLLIIRLFLLTIETAPFLFAEFLFQERESLLATLIIICLFHLTLDFLETQLLRDMSKSYFGGRGCHFSILQLSYMLLPVNC